MLFFLVINTRIYAQQDVQFSQYIYNTVTINPGYTGSSGALNVAALHRSQWVGLDGAPSTQTLSLQSPIGLSRIGLGGSIINDVIGPVSETYFDANFAYRIPTSKKAKLSFGIKGGARLFNVDFNKLNKDNTDQVFFNDINNQFSPSLGLGAYYYTDDFYIGLSAPNILETKHLNANEIDDISSTSSVARERVNFYLIAGHTFYLINDIRFKPTILGRAVSGAPVQVDVSANFLFSEKLSVGLSYRWSAAFAALVGFQVSDTWLIGLAYDRETTELVELNSGSFEVILKYDLFKKRYPQTLPRYF